MYWGRKCDVTSILNFISTCTRWLGSYCSWVAGESQNYMCVVLKKISVRKWTGMIRCTVSLSCTKHHCELVSLNTGHSIVFRQFITIIIYLSCNWVTCWPIPVSRIQKSLQRSAMIPSASWGIVFFFILGNLLWGILFACCIQFLWPPLWSSGQSFWLQIQRSQVRFPALPDFLSSSGSGMGSTQPREVNWGATWIKSSGSGPENRY